MACSSVRHFPALSYITVDSPWFSLLDVLPFDKLSWCYSLLRCVSVSWLSVQTCFISFCIFLFIALYFSALQVHFSVSGVLFCHHWGPELHLFHRISFNYIACQGHHLLYQLLLSWSLQLWKRAQCFQHQALWIVQIVILLLHGKHLPHMGLSVSVGFLNLL